MHTQDTTPTGRRLHVGSEIVNSTLRLFDAEAERFGADPGHQGVAAAFRSMADDVRAGNPIDLSGQTSVELRLAVRSELGQISPDGSEPHDWRYVRDMAVLMESLEAM